MDNREAALITGLYVAVILFVALALLIGGTDMEEYITDWNNGLILSNERASWEANM